MKTMIAAALAAAVAGSANVPAPRSEPAAAKAETLAPVDGQGHVFGIADGTYQADGVLRSGVFFPPDLRFHSVRSVGNGKIVAKTKAYLLGIGVASAAANLQVIPTGGGRFDLLDLDSPMGSSYKKAGEGLCDGSGCSFTATVMNGALTLTETWIAAPAGFDLVNCSQIYRGTKGTYDGKFTPLPKQP